MHAPAIATNVGVADVAARIEIIEPQERRARAASGALDLRLGSSAALRVCAARLDGAPPTELGGQVGLERLERVAREVAEASVEGFVILEEMRQEHARKKRGLGPGEPEQNRLAHHQPGVVVVQSSHGSLVRRKISPAVSSGETSRPQRPTKGRASAAAR